jgi:uncharacterized membrane protein YdjX (TVP38/TMEM64 family)
VLLAITLVLMYVGRHSELNQFFGLEYLTQIIQNTGAFGIIMFTLVYVIGTLMNIPGMIFPLSCSWCMMMVWGCW